MCSGDLAADVTEVFIKNKKETEKKAENGGDGINFFHLYLFIFVKITFDFTGLFHQFRC